MAERLRESRDIAAVLRGGKRLAGRLAACHVRPRQDPDAPRVAVVASRKVGGAVARNRAKRLLREAARGIDWRGGTDVVLVARPSCASAHADTVAAEVASLAHQLDAAAAPLRDAS